jgi:hypothetical protein
VPIIRSYQLYTWQLVCFIQVMWPLPRRDRLEPDPPRQRPHNLHEIYQLPRVQPDGGQKTCPKYVEFRDKIKFWIFDASFWLFIRRLTRCSCNMCYRTLLVPTSREVLFLQFQIVFVHLLGRGFCVF